MRFKLRKCLVITIALSTIGSVYFYKNSILSMDYGGLEQRDSHLSLNNVGIEREKSNRHRVSRRDWHNYNAIEEDKKRTGPGEQGAAVQIRESERERSAYSENGFNIRVSDRISLNRSLSDIRHENCKTRQYLSDLPTASIIIPFHNEGWSTLFRTLHSIINRSPPKLLHEIILIDDFSSKDHLKTKLDLELKKYEQVKLHRLGSREGLIRARLAGVDRATGDVIVILDSHVEVTHNWLPPLLEPIALERTTVVCPMIDIVDKDNFRYLTQPGDAMRGAFDWELYYKRIPIPAERRPDDPSDPFEDPVMAGGLFAVERRYFDEIGGYDPGLEIWGGEQYELSFKVWMCGGRVLDAPCSRVGHLYREFMPYSLPKGTNINKNFKRVAEVWMDDYKEFFYRKRPHVRRIDPGDLEKQKRLRVELGCKSFDWFMKEVAPDIARHYPPVVPHPAAWGTVYNEGTGLCLDTMHRPQGGAITVARCQTRGEQQLLLTWREDIRPGQSVETARKVCVDAQGLNRPVVVWECHGQHGNQLWKYLVDKKQIYHGHTGLCATADREGEPVSLLPCDLSNKKQAWRWQNKDLEQLSKFNAKPNAPA